MILGAYPAHGKNAISQFRTTAGLSVFKCVLGDGAVSPGTCADRLLALDNSDLGDTVAGAPSPPCRTD